MSTWESEINMRLADILRKNQNLTCYGERQEPHKRRDVVCYVNGLIIVLEASYSKKDAEDDAKRRVEEGIADLIIAVHYPSLLRRLQAEEIERALAGGKFEIKLFVPKHVDPNSLLNYLGVHKVLVKASEWFEADLSALAELIRHAAEYMILETEISKTIDKSREVINSFVESLKNNEGLCESIKKVMYALYGLQGSLDCDIALAQAGLSLLLASTFYEHIRNYHSSLMPLKRAVLFYGGPIDGFSNALHNLRKIDYKEAIELALEILSALPSSAAQRVLDLIDLGVKISQ
ncbi:MAG: hypothetical protein ACP5GH_07350, partial [Nitrososphaeria archaeon]